MRLAEEHLKAAEAFAEAAIDSGAWLTALRGLASATGSSHAELIGIRGDEVSFCVSETPEAAQREFMDSGAYDRGVNPRVAASTKATPMQVVGDRDYDTAALRLQIESYMDLVRKYDIPHGCQTSLHLDANALIGLAVLRTHREARIDAEATSAFAALAPHALAAVRTRLALGDQSLRDIASGLEHAGVAAFMCDGDGRVRAMTDRGERLAADGSVLSVRQGRLAAPGAQDDRRLRTALGAALAGALTTGATEALVFGPPGRRCAVHVRVLPADHWVLAFQPRVIVIVREGRRVPSEQILRLAFGLTAAEAEIALALATGLSRERIALRRNVSLGTLRQQIKSIFAKADVSREAELVVAVQALG